MVHDSLVTTCGVHVSLGSGIGDHFNAPAALTALVAPIDTDAEMVAPPDAATVETASIDTDATMTMVPAAATVD